MLLSPALGALAFGIVFASCPKFGISVKSPVPPTGPSDFSVCIICALPLEARAVMEVFEEFRENIEDLGGGNTSSLGHATFTRAERSVPTKSFWFTCRAWVPSQLRLLLLP
jgi:hypothetical protein